jgi:diguanylate cyclase (GGDEF)-like protein/PAS domain S-box-containing protein
MLNLMPDVVVWQIKDTNLEIEYVSDTVKDIFGIDADALMNKPVLWLNMVHTDDRKRITEFFSQLKSRPQTDSIDFRILNVEGDVRWVSNRISHNAKEDNYTGVTFDVTSKQESRERIEFLAYHDSLTQLPNREFLKRKLLTCIEYEAHCTLSVLFVDLNNFKYINDTLGHEVGDKILISVGNRLKEHLGEHESVVRFGGDEFIIVKKYSDTQSAYALGKKIVDLFKVPFHVIESNFDLNCSIGISNYPEDSSNAVSLIQHADIAMYSAKESGRDKIQIYSQKLESELKHFHQINAMIKEALANGYFDLCYQPIVSARTHNTLGFEALIRLNHPKHALISPADFIPVAEKTGDILLLGEMAFKEAVAFALRIKARSLNDFYVSINVSAKQFKKGFAKRILKYLQKKKLPTHHIKIELTETVMMENIEISKYELELLSLAGIRISLDDFGTGYSSFEYLATLPIETIKIDQSFIKKMDASSNDSMIVKTIAKMSSLMKKNVVAEGVETLDQVKQLKKFKITSLQGYYFSKPMNSTDAIAHLLEYQENAFIS